MPSPTPTFEFTVRPDYGIEIRTKDIYDLYKKTNFKPGQKGYLSIRRMFKKRTSGQYGEQGNQNGYYWGAVLPIIAEHTGHTPEELHEIHKQMFCPKKRYLMKDGRSVTVSRSTADLNTVEFTEYLERIRAHWAQDGVVIPDPVKVEVISETA
jgi:hypothetical protein